MAKRSGRRSGRKPAKKSNRRSGKRPVGRPRKGSKQKKRSQCNKKKSSQCKRSRTCNWVKRKSKGKRRHVGYCRGSSSGRPVLGMGTEPLLSLGPNPNEMPIAPVLSASSHSAHLPVAPAYNPLDPHGFGLFEPSYAI